MLSVVLNAAPEVDETPRVLLMSRVERVGCKSRALLMFGVPALRSVKLLSGCARA